MKFSRTSTQTSSRFSSRNMAGWRRSDFDRLADVPPAGKSPSVGKARALPRLHRLNRAGVATVEKNAFAVRARMQHQGRAIGMQMRVARHEILNRQPEMNRDALRLALAEPHEARPAAAISAALAEVGFRNCRHQPDLARLRGPR